MSKGLIIVLISFIVFVLLSYSGFVVGRDFGFWLMWETFGEPKDLYPFLYATVMFFLAIGVGSLGVIVTFLTLHWLGRRLKVAVGKPTLLGFLLYLLTLLILILNYNRTH